MHCGMITKIEEQKKGKNRVNVYVDEEFSFSCNLEIVYSLGLQTGAKVDDERIIEIVSEDEYIRCKNSALRTIEKTYKSEKEVRDKLLTKGFEESTIERTIQFLKSYNFIDDDKFADMYIRDRINNEGIYKIKSSLSRKGIPKEIIESKIEQIDHFKIESSAEKLAADKYRAVMKSENDKRKIYKKVGDFLIRKGYSFDETKSALKKVLNCEDEE